MIWHHKVSSFLKHVQPLGKYCWAQREQEERNKQVRQELEAIQKAAATRPGKFRTRLPDELYIQVHAALADEEKAAEEALHEAGTEQNPAAKEAATEEDKPLLFFVMRTMEAPKLAATAQKAAELQAKEVRRQNHTGTETLCMEIAD